MYSMVVAFFVGCSTSGPCKTLESITEHCGESFDQADLEECQASVEPCSAKERQAIGEFYRCAMTCDGDTGAEKTPVFETFAACFAGVEGLSKACLDAAVDGSTPAT